MADAWPNPVLAFFTKFILSLLARINIHEELNPDPQTSSHHNQQGFDYHQALLMAFWERNLQRAMQVMVEHMESAESFMMNTSRPKTSLPTHSHL